MARLEQVTDAQFEKFARLLRRGQHLGREWIGDARIGAATVVVDGDQAGQGVGIEAFDGDPVVAVERRVESLDQKQVAVAVDGQTGAIFARAVEQAVGVGIFAVQACDQRLAGSEGSVQEVGQWRGEHRGFRTVAGGDHCGQATGRPSIWHFTGRRLQLGRAPATASSGRRRSALGVRSCPSRRQCKGRSRFPQRP